MSAVTTHLRDSRQTIFTPVTINQLPLKNRIALAPMTRVSATSEGLVTDSMARYYERFARGGFGLLITEGNYTDNVFSQGYRNQPGLSADAQARAWRRVTDAVHAAGGKIVAQLMHAGALSQFNRYRDHTVGPSAVRPKGEQMAIYRGVGEYPVPKVMSAHEIAEAIAGFGRAAALAIDVAGFDGVEIHGANGYLLDQFLTDYTNRRIDEWGGSVERRARLLTEVTRHVRRTIGADATLGVRVSQAKVNDFEHRWRGANADAASVFGALAREGVDYIHITEFEAWRPAFGDDGPSLVSLARMHAPDAIIIANGNLANPHRAASMLAQGADIVALGRGALSNPDWPNRVSAQQPLAEFDPAILRPLADIKPYEHC
jgi:2,4-dienoyl-CoA reductase-like NADH-dependent reductase (Old Yellow Enzyme family)